MLARDFDRTYARHLNVAFMTPRAGMMSARRVHIGSEICNCSSDGAECAARSGLESRHTVILLLCRPCPDHAVLLIGITPVAWTMRAASVAAGPRTRQWPGAASLNSVSPVSRVLPTSTSPATVTKSLRFGVPARGDQGPDVHASSRTFFGGSVLPKIHVDPVDMRQEKAWVLL